MNKNLFLNVSFYSSFPKRIKKEMDHREYLLHMIYI